MNSTLSGHAGNVTDDWEGDGQGRSASKRQDPTVGQNFVREG